METIFESGVFRSADGPHDLTDGERHKLGLVPALVARDLIERLNKYSYRVVLVDDRSVFLDGDGKSVDGIGDFSFRETNIQDGMFMDEDGGFPDGILVCFKHLSGLVAWVNCNGREWC